MSLFLGEMRQLAFVVRDLDAALAYWTKTLEVGPFYVMREIVPFDWRYYGEPSPAPRISLALGYSGDLQIELVQQHDEHPSAYRDFLRSGREGAHHVSSWVTRPDYDRNIAAARARGIRAAHEGALGDSGIRFVYFATETAPGGIYYEMSEAKEPPFGDIMARIREIAKHWDGSDPVGEGLP